MAYAFVAQADDYALEHPRCQLPARPATVALKTPMVLARKAVCYRCLLVYFLRFSACIIAWFFPAEHFRFASSTHTPYFPQSTIYSNFYLFISFDSSLSIFGLSGLHQYVLVPGVLFVMYQSRRNDILTSK